MLSLMPSSAPFAMPPTLPCEHSESNASLSLSSGRLGVRELQMSITTPSSIAFLIRRLCSRKNAVFEEVDAAFWEFCTFVHQAVPNWSSSGSLHQCHRNTKWHPSGSPLFWWSSPRFVPSSLSLKKSSKRHRFCRFRMHPFRLC
jgi:hypothetical protein